MELGTKTRKKTRPLQCFRCQQWGHVRTECKVQKLTNSGTVSSQKEKGNLHVAVVVGSNIAEYFPEPSGRIHEEQSSSDYLSKEHRIRSVPDISNIIPHHRQFTPSSTKEDKL